MSNRRDQEFDPHQPTIYQIRIKGHLVGQRWADWFEGLTITLKENGDTFLTGPVDQTALHGLLKKVRDLGMPLLSVNRVESGQTEVRDTEQSVEAQRQKEGAE